MASLQFYAMWEEALDLLGAIAEEHALGLVPEIPVLAEPGLKTFERMCPEVATMLATYPVVQLEGAFTQFPLAFDQRNGGTAAGTYAVSDTVGPRLRLFMPGMNGTELTPGSLSMLDNYFNPDTETYVAPTAELSQAYKAIVASLETHLVRHRVRKNDVIWIGARTKRELDQGNVLLRR